MNTENRIVLAYSPIYGKTESLYRKHSNLPSCALHSCHQVNENEVITSLDPKTLSVMLLQERSSGPLCPAYQLLLPSSFQSLSAMCAYAST